VTQEAPPVGQEQAALRIDEVDDDSEVKPVVLLSPRRKTAENANSADGAFMSDLERRLREDAEG
jgi:hypothetical protein